MLNNRIDTTEQTKHKEKQSLQYSIFPHLIHVTNKKYEILQFDGQTKIIARYIICTYCTY